MESTSISPSDLRRLEEKVDKLTDAVMRLVLVEERQANQGQRIGAVEQSVAVATASISKVDSKVDKWVNRGIGVWALAAVLFALVQLGAKFAGK
jgi:uncharacterized protein with PhoU and TrkA domain